MNSDDGRTSLRQSLLQMPSKDTHRHADDASQSQVPSASVLSNKLARVSARFPAPPPDGQPVPEEDAQVARIIRTSLAVNFILFLAKFYSFITTGSLSVLASLVDSAIDLVAQSVIMVANHMSEKASKNSKDASNTIYPVGMSRVEPLGVIICAVLMMMAAFEVIQKSSGVLYNFWGSATGPSMTFDNASAVLLSGVILLKIALWRWCVQATKKTSNVSLEAISLDNWNDVISNIAALAAAMLTRYQAESWLADPLGAILISLYIIWAWLKTAKEQIDMLVGKGADPDFLATVREIAETHDPNAEIDVVRAYHFGPKFLVEIELVMDRRTPLQVSHDVGMLLQDRIEHLEDCERCFVHIDYEHRPNDDHDTSVPIHRKICVERVGMQS